MTQPTGSRRSSIQDGAAHSPAKPDDKSQGGQGAGPGQGDAVRTGALGQHAVSLVPPGSRPAAGALVQQEVAAPDLDSKSVASRKAQLPMPAGSPPPLKAKDLALLMSDMTAVYKVVGQHKEAVARQKLEAIFDGAIAKVHHREGEGFSAQAVGCALFAQSGTLRAGAHEATGKAWSWDDGVLFLRAAIASASKVLGDQPARQLLPLAWVRDGNPNAVGQALFLELAKGGGGAAPLLAEGLATLAQAAQAQDLPGEYLSEAAASLVRGFAAVTPPPDGKAQGARLAAIRGHDAAATSLLTAARSLLPAQLESLSVGLAKGWERAKSGDGYADSLLGSVLTDSVLQSLDASKARAIVRGWRDGSLAVRLPSAGTPAQTQAVQKAVRERLQGSLDQVHFAAPYAELGRQLQAVADALKPPPAAGVSSSSSADPKR